ncbi:GH3 auxin-responsive promoter family protein [Patescibacteria group bacterium]|nr:GH3 auxin-responsive promoter family protein [Patescibacteria group bacterium]MBU1758262.1 GH3 auxin-responsive promoter family protein [Patescibacteria group bacterium]
MYYFDERHDTQVLGEPKINTVKQGTFYDWLKFNGKLGGQFKIPKLSNDRENLDSML